MTADLWSLAAHRRTRHGLRSRIGPWSLWFPGMLHAKIGVWVWLRWLAARGRLLVGDGIALAVSPAQDTGRLRIDDLGDLLGFAVGLVLAFVQLLVAATVLVLVGVAVPPAAPYADAAVSVGLPLVAVSWGLWSVLRLALVQIGGGEIRSASLAEDSAVQLLRRQVPLVGTTVFRSGPSSSVAAVVDGLLARAAPGRRPGCSSTGPSSQRSTSAPARAGRRSVTAGATGSGPCRSRCGPPPSRRRSGAPGSRC